MKKRLITGCVILLSGIFSIYALATLDSKRSENFDDRLFSAHSKFKETSLQNRRFKQATILPLIEKRKNSKLFEISEVGKSFEGRTIQMVKAGTGKTKVLLWSQMHGDEPTATMAIFDILNFLEANNDGLDGLRNNILKNTSLYFVPMLNPDGAEKYERRNAQGIDLNRDAAYLQAPESNILKNLQHSLNPEFGFNLHDQSPRYSVGRSNKVAAITFLATAYDYDRNVNDVRKRAMQLVVGMNKGLQKYVPGQVARYNDTHEPRGFGDNVQKWGTTLVLIESGGYIGDPEKQYLRQLNFMAILSSLNAIASKSYASENHAEYETIPENANYIYDLVIRHGTVTKNGKQYKSDFGINRHELSYDKASRFFYRSSIADYGDMSTHFGSEELDATGLKVEKGKVYPTILKNSSEIKNLDAESLLKQGYLYVRVQPGPNTAALGSYFTTQPFHVLRKGQVPGRQSPELGEIATFLLKDGDNVRYAVVNGFVYDMKKPLIIKGNGLME